MTSVDAATPTTPTDDAGGADGTALTAEDVEAWASLSDLQRVALAAYLEHGDVNRAAEESGASKRTIYRWLAGQGAGSGAFAEAVNGVRRARYAAVLGRLGAASSIAVEKLVAILEAEDTPPRELIAAARVVLDGLRAGQAVDVETEIRRLGEIVADMQMQGGAR